MIRRDQYVSSGRKHVEKDEPVDDDMVKKVQKVANDHTWWLRRILRCGEAWNHDDRMSSNMVDNTEVVAPMYLLVKDHKGLSQKPIRANVSV